MTEVNLGGVLVGDGHPAYVISELGINHGGSVTTAEKLIDASAYAGAQAVKTQKRTVDVVYPKHVLDSPRESPWGTDTRAQKLGLELGEQAYRDLARYARAKGLAFTASCWDLRSLDDVMAWTSPPFLKIASAVLTWPSGIRDPLLKAHAQTGLPLVMSTGMSDTTQIDEAIDVLTATWAAEPSTAFGAPGLVLLACTSTYPCEDHEINLKQIETLQFRYGSLCVIGYSGHEKGIATTVAAVALGAKVVERHITLDRASYGSDQSASLEPPGFARMVRDIRVVEAAMGNGDKRCLESESVVRAKLMRRDAAE